MHKSINSIFAMNEGTFHILFYNILGVQWQCCRQHAGKTFRRAKLQGLHASNWRKSCRW